jgi:FkbM family methyltransferase
MRHVLKPGDGIVDAGANIGWFSLVVGQCVGATGRIYAFEPQPRVFRYVQRTVRKTGL